MEGHPISKVEVSICDSIAAVRAETGATYSVAGEILSHFPKKNDQIFNNAIMEALVERACTKNRNPHCGDGYWCQRKNN
ncbi:hypothetical protein CEXT_33441 [Caerostris extrusa]|uniref:Uncharacterized protein n=1 Tax=Caerostris extrusa TaxID=172846 RepID=A0AAV4USN5_CAEEX|nr:hypothetical protein CEXT_33441 [Caerostris extrusa]